MASQTDKPVETVDVATGEIEYNTLPEATVLMDGHEVVGKFIRLMEAPEHPEYGIALIVEFEGIRGTYTDKNKKETKKIVPGNKYGMYLITQVVEDAVLDGNPQGGETIAFRYDGRRESGQRTDPKGNPTEYTVIAVAFPDRVKDTTPLSIEEAKKRRDDRRKK